MKYYKDQNDGVYLLVDAVEPNANWLEISKAEWDGLNIQPELTDEQKRALLKPLTARQVRLILTQFGYRAQVESAISQATQNVQDEWNYANEFDRASPVLNGMAQMLGLADSDVDLMFEIGANL